VLSKELNLAHDQVQNLESINEALVEEKRALQQSYHELTIQSKLVNNIAASKTQSSPSVPDSLDSMVVESTEAQKAFIESSVAFERETLRLRRE
jgi:hypothetical protein